MRRPGCATPQGTAHATSTPGLGELVWRDFYHQLLAHHPRIAHEPFVEAAQTIPYANDPAAYAAWCEGRTGYPIVDAAMKQIAATGFMHNRLRMVVASFLTKDLGIDWRRGAAFFAQHLNDYELASNNGNWQWAASTGCDAQPWFRIFNPQSQAKKFDPQGRFVAQYLGEPPNESPAPIVDHDEARAKTLARYSAALKADSE